MSRYNQLAQKVLKVHKDYRGELPLSIWLRDFFKNNRQMGSTDRKLFSSLLYGIYRWTGARQETPGEREVEIAACMQPYLPPAYAAFLSSKDELYHDLLQTESIADKLHMVSVEGWSLPGYFPAEDSISSHIDKRGFIQSHLVPRYVWVRLRKNCKDEVLEAFQEAGYAYELYSDTCYRMKGHYPLHTMDVFLKGCLEIQDIASQDTGAYFSPKDGELWFDCCAGSGGKSLMLLDKTENISLTVNDTRGEMLDELRDRFEKAGMPVPKVMQSDLSVGIYEGLGPFDGIIADLPCSGSGTWGRSPERMQLFQPEQIEAYAEKQRAIIRQVSKVVKPGAPIFYITCSVYAEENEMNVDRICTENGLTCAEQHYLNHHKDGGDTLFISILSKS